MATIKFIHSSGGVATTEQLLQIINQHPEGSTMKELSQIINRPVSMINLCLKTLIIKKQIKVELSQSRMQKLFFPKFKEDKRSHLIKLLRKL